MANILLYEDDDQLAMLIQTSLSSEGHQVEIFDQFDPAIEFVLNKPIDLVIADLFINDSAGQSRPGGIALISQIRQTMKSKIPILAISGAFSGPAKVNLMSSARTVGASQTLSKPFHPDELLDAIFILLKNAAK